MEGDNPAPALTRAESRWLGKRVQLDNGNAGLVIAAYERNVDDKRATICRIALDNGMLTAVLSQTLQVID